MQSPWPTRQEVQLLHIHAFEICAASAAAAWPLLVRLGPFAAAAAAAGLMQGLRKLARSVLACTTFSCATYTEPG